MRVKKSYLSTGTRIRNTCLFLGTFAFRSVVTVSIRTVLLNVYSFNNLFEEHFRFKLKTLFLKCKSFFIVLLMKIHSSKREFMLYICSLFCRCALLTSSLPICKVVKSQSTNTIPPVIPINSWYVILSLVGTFLFPLLSRCVILAFRDTLFNSFCCRCAFCVLPVIDRLRYISVLGMYFFLI